MIMTVADLLMAHRKNKTLGYDVGIDITNENITQEHSDDLAYSISEAHLNFFIFS